MIFNYLRIIIRFDLSYINLEVKNHWHENEENYKRNKAISMMRGKSPRSDVEMT